MGTTERQVRYLIAEGSCATPRWLVERRLRGRPRGCDPEIWTPPRHRLSANSDRSNFRRRDPINGGLTVCGSATRELYLVEAKRQRVERLSDAATKPIRGVTAGNERQPVGHEHRKAHDRSCIFVPRSNVAIAHVHQRHVCNTRQVFKGRASHEACHACALFARKMHCRVPPLSPRDQFMGTSINDAVGRFSAVESSFDRVTAPIGGHSTELKFPFWLFSRSPDARVLQASRSCRGAGSGESVQLDHPAHVVG